MPCILMNAIITRQILSTIRTKDPRGTFHLRCNETSFANTLLRPRAAIHVLIILTPFSFFLSFLESMEYLVSNLLLWGSRLRERKICLEFACFVIIVRIHIKSLDLR